MIDDEQEPDEHALFHRLGELEDEIAMALDLARESAGLGDPATRTRFDADLERLRRERSHVLGRLGERGRTHRLQAHNDHQRRLRRALAAYNDAAAKMNDALREAQALSAITILLPGDAARAGETILAPPCDVPAMLRVAPAAPIRLAPDEPAL